MGTPGDVVFFVISLVNFDIKFYGIHTLYQN